MKITIVAFDLWGFNKKIADHLISNGHEVTFIDSSKINFKYKSQTQRIYNFFSKLFLNKNIKKDYRNRTVLNIIKNLEIQDYVLIVNPDHFVANIVNALKSRTKKYIAHNYDSLDRNPLPSNHLELFDKIYSFDINDVQKNNYLTLLTNFIYTERNFNTQPKNKAFMILSKSEDRERMLSKIANIFDKKQIHNYEFIVANPATTDVNKNIVLTEDHFNLEDVLEKVKNSEILIDLVRKKQSGLSFRFFEAMAFEKKIITNNKTVSLYDFYNPNNILILEDNFEDIDDNFLNSKYEKLSEEIYKKYTIDSWVEKVFEINNK